MPDPPRGNPNTDSTTRAAAGADVEPADADFLFHLYRGSELLRDHKVREAKGEIENALRLQPRDPHGQDLLGRVYFRLGVYPQAIALYEALVDDYPKEASPRINLALCYLKTGQPDLARQHLEVAVEREPQRTRAWGYLGLAFERLGKLEKAKAAFERGGHHTMARRVDDLLVGGRAAPDEPPPPSSATPVQLAEVRRVAEEAFHELDLTDMAFSIDVSLPPRSPSDSGSWRSVEVGQVSRDDAGAEPTSKRGGRGPDSWTGQTLDDAASVGADERPKAVSKRPRDLSITLPASEFARENGFVFPRPGRASRRTDGSVLVTVDGEFAVRLDLVRALSTAVGMPTSSVLRRKGRGSDSEAPVGDPLRPVSLVSGVTNLVLCSVYERALTVLDLRDDLLVVREEAMAGFDPRLEMGSGRLPSGHGDMASMVQLRGNGCAIIESRGPMGSMELKGPTACLVRGASLLGWLGRPSVRNVPLSEAPGNARGWLAFTGEGWVLVDTSPSRDFGQG